LANFHFWLGFIGIIAWVVPMWWAGATQGLMWKDFTTEGLLKYPNFLETVLQLVPMYIMRAIGGTLFLTGACVMVYNLYKTMRLGDFLPEEEAQAPALEKKEKTSVKEKTPYGWHGALERKPVQFFIWALIAILIGGIVEMVPMFLVKSNVPTISSVMPYTPLELEGRDIYIREGCVNCHTQWVRPFRSETERYGETSKSGEFVYDHPFLWGSKRTGPDLHRIGGKYPHGWHYQHMMDPRSTSPGSIMPPYPWLYEDDLDVSRTLTKISALRRIGVPYAKDYEDLAMDDLNTQAAEVVRGLKEASIEADSKKEIIALIAYLQRLGTDIKAQRQMGITGK